jgi:FAD/FMN-containing dehydrogenase
MQEHGTTCENVLAADVVTSGGQFVRASRDELGDLRDGGVVTAVELELHPVGPEVTAGVLVFNRDDGRAWAGHAADGLTTLAAVSGTVVAVAACFAGDHAAAARAFRTLTELGAPTGGVVRVRSYTDVQACLLRELYGSVERDDLVADVDVPTRGDVRPEAAAVDEWP